MFSSNDTPAEEYAYANEIGATINLDDITHIEFLDKILTVSSRRQSAAVIIRADISKLGTSYYG